MNEANKRIFNKFIHLIYINTLLNNFDINLANNILLYSKQD